MVEKFLEDIYGNIYKSVWNTWDLNHVELIMMFSEELLPSPMGRNTIRIFFSMLTIAW